PEGAVSEVARVIHVVDRNPCSGGSVLSVILTDVKIMRACDDDPSLTPSHQYSIKMAGVERRDKHGGATTSPRRNVYPNRVLTDLIAVVKSADVDHAEECQRAVVDPWRPQAVTGGRGLQGNR